MSENFSKKLRDITLDLSDTEAILESTRDSIRPDRRTVQAMEDVFMGERSAIALKRSIERGFVEKNLSTVTAKFAHAEADILNLIPALGYGASASILVEDLDTVVKSAKISGVLNHTSLDGHHPSATYYSFTGVNGSEGSEVNGKLYGGLPEAQPGGALPEFTQKGMATTSDLRKFGAGYATSFEAGAASPIDFFKAASMHALRIGYHTYDRLFVNSFIPDDRDGIRMARTGVTTIPGNPALTHNNLKEAIDKINTKYSAKSQSLPGISGYYLAVSRSLAMTAKELLSEDVVVTEERPIAGGGKEIVSKNSPLTGVSYDVYDQIGSGDTWFILPLFNDPDFHIYNTSVYTKRPLPIVTVKNQDHSYFNGGLVPIEFGDYLSGTMKTKVEMHAGGATVDELLDLVHVSINNK